MKLQVRPTALEDLAQGRRFYDSQELGVGDYFFDSVFAVVAAADDVVNSARILDALFAWHPGKLSRVRCAVKSLYFAFDPFYGSS